MVTIHISDNAISFYTARQGRSADVGFETYPSNTAISTSANLRQAFDDDRFSRFDDTEALVVVDTPILLLPIEEFEAGEKETLYHHSFHIQPSHKVAHAVLPSLNAVALFAVYNDIDNVIADKYRQHDYMPMLQTIWKYAHKRSFTGSRANLFVFFHDNKTDIMSFRQNRFRFYNRFDTHHYMDAVFFILYVWKQLGMDTAHDNLHILGTAKEQDSTVEELKKYVKNVRLMNINADMPRTKQLSDKAMPIDLQLLYTLGR